MIELGQLERHQEEFAKRNVRVLVVSLDGQDDSEKTQAQFPHLLVVADADRGLINAASVLHAHAGPEGADAAAPTTILIDRGGVVRWMFRPDLVLTRLSPEEVLAAVDTYLP